MKLSRPTKTYEFARDLTKYKSLELQFTWWDYWFDIFRFNVNWSVRGDHAGFGFEVTLFMFAFDFDIRDHRHWDYENDRWEKCDCDED